MHHSALAAITLAMTAALGAQDTRPTPPAAEAPITFALPTLMDFEGGLAVAVQKAHPGHMDHDELLKAIRQIVREEVQRALHQHRGQRAHRGGRWNRAPRRAGPTFRWVPEGPHRGHGHDGGQEHRATGVWVPHDAWLRSSIELPHGKAAQTIEEHVEREASKPDARQWRWAEKEAKAKTNRVIFGRFDEKSDRVFRVNPIETRSTAATKKKATTTKAMKVKATATKKVEPAPLRITWDENTMRPAKMKPAGSKSVEAEIQKLENELEELKRALEKRRKDLRSKAKDTVLLREYRESLKPMRSPARKVDVIETLPAGTRIIDAKGRPVQGARVRLIAPDKSVRVRKARSV